MTDGRDEDLDQGDEPFETTHVVDGREYPLTVTTDEDGHIELLAQPAVLGAWIAPLGTPPPDADNVDYDETAGRRLGRAHIDRHRSIPLPDRIALPETLGGPSADDAPAYRRLNRADRRDARRAPRG